jgi:hypothetical protein
VFPQLEGRPIRVKVRRSLGSHLAAASIPGRLILLDDAVFARCGEFERILIHELFHFAWVRLSNQQRREWEEVLTNERASGTAGELGWSAEWRKDTLSPKDLRSRTPRWRRYACVSFCDTAAWLYAGLARHDEFTLASPLRRLRRQWFERTLEDGRDTLKV